MSERDRVAAALSGNSSVSSFSRPPSQTPSVSRQHPTTPHANLTSPKVKKCSIQYDNGTGLLSPRLQAQIDAESRYQRKVAISASLNKPLPMDPEMVSSLLDCEPFTLADVPSRCIQPGRSAYVQSMAATTHSSRTTMGPPSHARNISTEYGPPSPLSRNPPDPNRHPTHSRDPSLTSDPRPTHSREPSAASARRPTHSRNISNTSAFSATSDASRTYAFPALAHAEMHSRPITSHPNTSHPSTRLLLTHIPQHHFLSLSGFLLYALESATLPTTPKPSSSTTNAPPVGIPWYTSWPSIQPLPPLSQRTTHNLRTTNNTTQTITKNTPANPQRTGQLSHLQSAVPFRWTKRTQKHGPPTDFSHPAYAAVGATRALWQKGYRDEAYCGIKVGRAGVLRGGTRKNRWEGHWLRREGGLRGLKVREERVEMGVGRRETDGEDWWDGEEGGDFKAEGEGAVGQGIDKLKRMGNTIGGGLTRMASKLGRGKKEEQQQQVKENEKVVKEKRVYQPVSPSQDRSGWYTDSDDDD